MNAAAWRLTLAAAALMALVAGGRATFGLFVSPLNSASGLGLAALSFALALGQLAIGLVQPLSARWSTASAPRASSRRRVVLAVATALPAWSPLPARGRSRVIASAVAGSAVGSNGLLVGEVGRAVRAARAGFAVGLVGAGASVGQLLLGPATQWAIDRARLGDRAAGGRPR